MSGFDACGIHDKNTYVCVFRWLKFNILKFSMSKNNLDSAGVKKTLDLTHRFFFT